MEQPGLAKKLNREMHSETKISLGLVHYADGVAGTSARMATAGKYLSDFFVSTECGFGRRATDTIPDLLRIHAEVARV